MPARAEQDPVAEADLVAHATQTVTAHGGLVNKSDRRFAGRSGAVRGYGSSLIIAEGHITVVSDRWLSKVAQALGAKVERNYGVGGSSLLVNQQTSGWAQIWAHQADRLPTPGSGGVNANDVRPPSQGLIGLQHGINDYGNFGNQGTFAAAFQKSLEAIVRMLRAGYAWRSSSGRFTKTGWSNSSSTGFGGAFVTRADAGQISFATMSGFPGGTMTFYIAQRLDSGENCRVQVSIDGGPVVLDLNTAGIGVNLQSIVIPIVVPNVPAGNGHTVLLDFISMAGGGVKFLGGTLASAWPPMVLLVGQPTTPTMPPTSEPQMTQAVLDAGNAAHSTVAGLFTDAKVLYVDLTSMNGDASYWQDDVHFNPKGHAQIADMCLAALANAGGVPAGFSAGPVNDWPGTPDWSGAPGTQIVYDTTTGKLWTPKSITAGDWAAVQPSDTDLDAIAALTTTAYGRAFLALADAAAGRSALGLGTAATANTGAFDAAGAAAAAQAASQPLDADLTSIAALATTAFGRALLVLADPTNSDKYLDGSGAFSYPANRVQKALAARNLGGENFSLAAATSSAAVASQQVFLGLLGLLKGDVVANVVIDVAVAAAGTVPTRLELAIVDKTGVTLATSGNVASDAKWTSTGPKAFALSAPYTVLTSDGYYLAILQNGAFATTPLQLTRQNSLAGGAQALSGGVRLIAATGGGVTTITGTLTLQDPGAGTAYWFAWN
jgi:lysophospholipase L1-like esterase